MVAIKIDKRMAEEIAYSFFSDVRAYVNQHKEEYEEFLKEEIKNDTKNNQIAGGKCNEKN